MLCSRQDIDVGPGLLDEVVDLSDFGNRRLHEVHQDGEHGSTIYLIDISVTLITSRSFESKKVFEAGLR